MTGEVRVTYRKYDGSLHWHLTMRRLGEDEHGVWTGMPPASTMRKGDGPIVAIPHAHVMLFPRGQWWTAAFNDGPDEVEIYCDITTPVHWPSPDEVTMTDLDLDVCRLRSGAVELLDEDEFAEHRLRYGYPADVISEAEKSARWLLAALADGTEPFAGAYRSYLALVTGDGGA
jgi:uncharacterized protein